MTLKLTEEQILQKQFEDSMESLDKIRDREYRLHENMECVHEGVVEDSEDFTLRSVRSRKMLQQRPLPSYNPFE